MEISTKLVDRIVYARTVATGKRTLDIGGRGMPTPPEGTRLHGPETFSLKKVDPSQSKFAKLYHSIGQNAAEYRILDARNEPDVHYPLNLSEKGCIEKLRAIISGYRPEVIISMETLEHCNYHFEAMNEMARAVGEFGTEIFITIPNNANWILNWLGWNHDHCVAFLPDVGRRFVERSDLGRHQITYIPCFQQYLWYWRLAYAASFFQPFSLGFHIRPASK
ncbi:MAG TPA: hypothetical protein VN836_01935 [Verrucomicrobiae bacterium]|nr:hypothetical protein [Verrucomicrobiae bacterium]